MAKARKYKYSKGVKKRMAVREKVMGKYGQRALGGGEGPKTKRERDRLLVSAAHKEYAIGKSMKKVVNIVSRRGPALASDTRSVAEMLEKRKKRGQRKRVIRGNSY